MCYVFALWEPRVVIISLNLLLNLSACQYLIRRVFSVYRTVYGVIVFVCDHTCSALLNCLSLCAFADLPG